MCGIQLAHLLSMIVDESAEWSAAGAQLCYASWYSSRMAPSFQTKASRRAPNRRSSSAAPWDTAFSHPQLRSTSR